MMTAASNASSLPSRAPDRRADSTHSGRPPACARYRRDRATACKASTARRLIRPPSCIRSRGGGHPARTDRRSLKPRAMPAKPTSQRPREQAATGAK